MLVQVPLNLEGEVGGRHHHSGGAVPVANAVARWRSTESTACVVVVSDHTSDLALLSNEPVASRSQGYSTGGTAVLHRDERDPGQAHPRDEIIGLRFAVRASGSELDIAPREAAVRERTSNSLLGEVLILTIEPTERSSRAPDEVDVIHSAGHSATSNP